jgi:hypothetical protein
VEKRSEKKSGVGLEVVQRPFLAPIRPASGPGFEKIFWTSRFGIIYLWWIPCCGGQMMLDSLQSEQIKFYGGLNVYFELVFEGF